MSPTRSSADPRPVREVVFAAVPAALDRGNTAGVRLMGRQARQFGEGPTAFFALTTETGATA